MGNIDSCSIKTYIYTSETKFSFWGTGTWHLLMNCGCMWFSRCFNFCIFDDFQVRLDRVLADDAPFDVCSCQVTEVLLLVSCIIGKPAIIICLFCCTMINLLQRFSTTLEILYVQAIYQFVTLSMNWFLFTSLSGSSLLFCNFFLIKFYI